MRAFSKWLMHEEQKDLFEVLLAVTLNILSLALIALLLWPLDRTMLALRLAKGYGILWSVVFVSAMLLNRTQQIFRVNIYDHPDAYVNSNLAVSCFVQVGWSAFAALTVHGFAGGAPLWTASLLYLVGALSCLNAFFAVSSFYQGHIYKLISLPLALLSFVAFSVWPASGRALYGWFFDLYAK
jgi:hypothetical protein